MPALTSSTENAAPRYWPLGQLILARLREFYREPEAVFWVYGFPLLLVLALGIAFRQQPVESIPVAVVASAADAPQVERVLESLRKAPVRGADAEDGPFQFTAVVLDDEAARLQLRTGKVALVVVVKAAQPVAYEYWYDQNRPESALARSLADEVLQQAAGRAPKAEVADSTLEETGARYIDRLVPGMLGMSLMGGGLWGVGFATVNMRIRKLLKRFLATPMKRSQFLGAIMISRLLFMVPEVLALLIFARFSFGVEIHGSLWDVLLMILLGAFTFAGIGLLVASRAQTVEAVSGLMNLVMLPMWIFSGVFFSAARFPDAAQPFIKALPLTPLVASLRAITIEGAGVADRLGDVAILAAWGIVTFVLALKWFRWS